MSETEKISKLIIEVGGKEYELDGGGGSGPLPPDSVGTEQIIDGAVEMEDLHGDVVEKIQKTYVENDETMHMDFDVRFASTQPSSASDPIIEEEEEEP